jgi:hypothetical protein
MACARGCCDSPAEHYRSIGIASAALPTRRKTVVEGIRKDGELSKDRDAYQRLRRDGLQPDRLHGARDIESRAETRVEVERSTILTPEQRKTVESLRRDGAEV